MPFCAQKDCFNITMKYLYEPSNTSFATSAADIYRTAFEDQAGLLPISSTAAASSAFEGSTAVMTGIGAQQDCLALSVWSTGAGKGKAFAEANRLRDELFQPYLPGFGPSKELVQEVAKAGLQPLIDGGAADSTGIAIALGAGATEILAVTNTGPGSLSAASLFSIFAGSNTATNDVIASPTATEMADIFGKLDRIPALPGSRFLTAIIYGSIPCVTIENKFFGVPGNQKFTLNIIAVETNNITLGLIEEGFSYNSFFNFGTVTGEVARTLTDAKNKETTQGIIRKFFL